MIKKRNLWVILFCLLATILSCASGLYIAPEKTKFFAKKILIYDEENPLSDTSLELSHILAKEINYEVLSYNDLETIAGKNTLSFNDLLDSDIGIVIKLQNISFFHRDVIKKQPFVQVRIGKSPPLWEWIFLSSITSTFEAYDVNTGNILLKGTFPPETFRQNVGKYGIGRQTSCPKGSKFDFKTWAMSKNAIFFSEQYIRLYIGKHSILEHYKPKFTNSYFKLADKNAIKKLVSYIAKNIPTQ